MNTAQVQLKVSLSQQLSDLLQSKASKFGVPVTQFVKYLIIKEVDTETEEEYSVYQMSERSEKIAQEAMEQIDQAVDASTFFKQLQNDR